MFKRDLNYHLVLAHYHKLTFVETFIFHLMDPLVTVCTVINLYSGTLEKQLSISRYSTTETAVTVSW